MHEKSTAPKVRVKEFLGSFCLTSIVTFSLTWAKHKCKRKKKISKKNPNLRQVNLQILVSFGIPITSAWQNPLFLSQAILCRTTSIFFNFWEVEHWRKFYSARLLRHFFFFAAFCFLKSTNSFSSTYFDGTFYLKN